MNTKRNKRGFTIVELVVVIVVIAILAAVLIPTVSSLIAKANQSADQAAVRQMNTALKMYTAENGVPSDYFELKIALDEYGINTDNLTPVSKGYAFYWDKTENEIVLVAENETVSTDSIVINSYASENIAAAKIGDKTYNSIQEALNEAEDGATITLQNDIKSSETLIFSSGNDVTLDLNGKTLYNTEELWGSQTINISYYDVSQEKYDTRTIKSDGVIWVSSGHLTIKGDGVVRALANDNYAVSVTGTGSITIESGTFIGNVHAAYASCGTIYIKGGTFSIQQLQEQGIKNGNNKSGYGMVVNCKSQTFSSDTTLTGTSNIIITGGTFQEFDPACTESIQNLKTCSPLSDEYTTISSIVSFGGVDYTYYTVVKKAS